MRYSHLSAPLAGSLALHVALLNFGWEIYAARAAVATPWQQPASLRVRIAKPAARPPTETVPRPKAPPPPDLPKLAQLQPKPRTAAPAAPPALPAPAAVAPTPRAPIEPDAPEKLPDQGAELPDSAFADAGGVDEMARPLREPEFFVPELGMDPSTSARWVLQFDLLIDAQGKVVRVANVSEGLPRNVIGAVLAAFYTTPFEPAKLAGQPVAIRQRFEVRP